MKRSIGDSSFEEFVQAEGSRLGVLALGLAGNSHDAADLLQEALARVGERWERSDIEVPAAYVRTVMVRLNIDRVRRLRREVVSAATPETRPVSTADTGQVGEALLVALRTLTPRQRTAIALRFGEDLAVREIAEKMNCSEGTVRSTLSRGIDRLRTSMGFTSEMLNQRESCKP